ncbi:MAG TPA: putative sulfate exporter family transporter [Flavihumibacter sp.]|jgi:uncharacterized integral membrane protein (TIGR00698 family)
MAASVAKPVLNEDWTSVVLGALVIGLALAGLHLPKPEFNWSDGGSLSEKVFTASNLLQIGGLFLILLVIAVIGNLFARKPLRPYLISFPLVFIVSVLAMFLAGNKTIKDLNLEAVIFSLSLGLIIGNFFTLPDWLRASLSTELFVKIGLVLLGTSIIFGDMLKAGSLGLLQALVVVLSVWYFAFWVCKKLGVEDDMRMMISSAVSICGVSAAIATAGAISGDTKKLSYVISLVLVTAIPMMIGMPYLAQWMELPEAVTGAWLGGSIDTSGAVVAAGTLVGEEALKVSTIVKFSQNVLLGLAAFAISVYWTYTRKEGLAVEKPTLGVIWERFPKFVIGFVAASLLFSFVLDSETIARVKNPLKNIQTMFFVLAFTSIGLETKFSDLFSQKNRKPLYGFLIAQGFNIVITLIVAYLLFR